jgi:hypothetical protein
MTTLEHAVEIVVSNDPDLLERIHKEGDVHSAGALLADWVGEFLTDADESVGEYESTSIAICRLAVSQINFFEVARAILAARTHDDGEE